MLNIGAKRFIEATAAPFGKHSCVIDQPQQHAGHHSCIDSGLLVADLLPVCVCAAGR